MNLLEKIEKNKEQSGCVMLVVSLALLINFGGKYLASSWNLPVWLDCIGTCFVAYIYGPICGAIVGIGVNISYGIFDKVSVIYAVSGMFIGLFCGIMARKKYFDNKYRISIVIAVLTFVSAVISTPINLLFYNGYTSNLWGDGIFEMMRENNVHPIIASTMGEFAVDFLDKHVTVLLLVTLINFKRKISFRREKKVAMLLALVMALSCVGQISTAHAEGRDYKGTSAEDGFMTYTIYNDRNGLSGGEPNDIDFTNDGYVWIGTYSGLYRYDGYSFKLKHSDVIKNVKCLYKDDEGRMWIGTNDCGVAVMVDGEIANVVNESNGLTSNSISAIGCDNAGYYYIGSKGKMDVVRLSGGMEVVASIPEIDYTYSIAADETGLVVVVSNAGKGFVLKEGQLLYTIEGGENANDFSCVAFFDDEFWFANYSGGITKYHIDEQKAEVSGTVETGELRNIRSIILDENTGKKWICSDNGIAFWTEKDGCHKINTGSFSTSIDNAGVDYQGNLWFASSRMGLLKISDSVFSNYYTTNNYDTDVINAVTMWNDCFYIGSDNGLDIMTRDRVLVTDDELVTELQGQRIRNLMVDSKNHLWIAVSTGEGLVEVYPDGKICHYTEKDGMLGNRFRSTLELRNGVIAVAEDNGIDFIKDGKIEGTITAEDGLTTTMVLSMYESEDGTLYAATDGGGLFLINDGKIVNKYTIKDGLSSDVILRIVPDEEGLFLVASNGIDFLRNDGKLRYLDRFPYTNNFDMYPDSTGKLWVLSSAGVYVINRDELLKNREGGCTLLDSKHGLLGAITANSWSYLADDDKLYIPCDNGFYLVDMHDYAVRSVHYRIRVDHVLADDNPVEISTNRVIEIAGDSKVFSLQVVVPNFTANELYVGYRLMGYDSKETIVSVRELGDIYYSNLPSGSYRLVLSLYDEDKGRILEQVSYDVEKKMRIFDYWWFKAYVVVIYGMFLVWITWMIVRRRNDRLMMKEKAKLARLEREAQMSNETIMAIAKTVDAKDARTSRHSERVAEYSVRIAKALGWPEQDCEDLYKTGLLHDIGKIGIPDAVLNKPGKLSDEEYAIMKTHVDKGAEILRDFTIIKDVDLGTRFHHERFDGRGYPQGLKGEEIPIQARIIGIADAFDAMTSNRVYRQKLALDTVLEEMRRCSGSQFDPKLLEVFLKLIDDGEIDVEVLYENE